MCGIFMLVSERIINETFPSISAEYLNVRRGRSDTLNWFQCCENYSFQKSCSKVGSKDRTVALCGTCLLFNILKETRESRDL